MQGLLPALSSSPLKGLHVKFCSKLPFFYPSAEVKYAVPSECENGDIPCMLTGKRQCGRSCSCFFAAVVSCREIMYKKRFLPMCDRTACAVRCSEVPVGEFPLYLRTAQVFFSVSGFCSVAPKFSSSFVTWIHICLFFRGKEICSLTYDGESNLKAQETRRVKLTG